MGIPAHTYAQYENGTRGFSRHADRFARFFRVDLTWLITGKGDMVTPKVRPEIPIMGVVGAGSVILPIDDDISAAGAGDVDLPQDGTIAGLIIKGDSGYPRYQDGELLLFYTQPISIEEALNHNVIAQTLDGRRVVKMLRHGTKANHYTLESFNAPPERNVQLLAAYRLYGIIFR